MPGPPRPAITRLVKSADFERALSVRSIAASAHFALHHLAPDVLAAPDLSTSGGQLSSHPVDDLPAEESTGLLCQLGAVVPKRHARRAVTRSLLKRQIYGVAGRHLGHHAAGIWVVRLRAPFAPAQFPSAASEALRRCVRTELEGLFARAPAAGAQP